MSVTWTLTSDGKYKVESAEHLLQIMNQGSLFTDTGSFPTDYWASSYIQTDNIDLLDHHANIIPIGSGNLYRFSGEYDGDRYEISNWTCTGVYCGLFGYADGCKIERVRLSGVWVITGTTYGGFLCGYANTSTSIYDIEGDFSPGTSLTTTSTTASNVSTSVGGLVGYLRSGSDAYGLTVKGTIDVITSLKSAGGVIGTVYEAPVTMVRNLATFVSGVTGSFAGGVIGSAYITTITRLLNGMTGDVSGTGLIGGIIGQAGVDVTLDRVVNSMIGDILVDGSNDAVGGIVGRASPSATGGFTAARLLNYMTGDISLSSGSGGIVGISTNENVSLSLSISAMNGAVTDSIFGRWTAIPTLFTALSVDSFGMTSTADTNNTFVPSDSLLLNHPDLTTLGSGLESLPYFEMTGTDPDGTSYDWDFIYGNVGGNPSYQLYSHLVLHKGDIVHPLLVDLDIPENNTTVYTTLVNYTNDEAANHNSLTIISVGIPPPFAVDARSINISTRIAPVDGALGYRVTYQGPTGGEIISASDFTSFYHNITDVVSETTYVVRLYVNTGEGYVQTEEFTVTTLPNVASNYNVDDFVQDGVIQLASLSDNTFTNVSAFLSDLLTTGDVVSVVRDKPELVTSFVNLGERLSIKQVSGVLLPFSETSGGGQDVTVTLSDDSTDVSLNYNEVANSITVGSVEYFVGDSFVLDGRKITVIDI